MNTRSTLILMAFAGTAIQVFSQPAFIYDQQSALEGAPADGGGTLVSSQPFGQSFTPTLDSVGFIRLWLSAGNQVNGIGSTVYVNVRSGSITGPVLGFSDSIFMPDRFGFGTNEYPDFFFSTPVSVTPGVIYYFQPVLQSGDTMAVLGDVRNNYPGGSIIIRGSPNAGDLWFREGIVVPEPAAGWLVLAGAGVWLSWRRWRAGPA